MRTGQLLDLHPEEGDGGEEVHRGLQVLQLLGVAGGEVVAVHGQVDPQGVVQRVQQLDKLVFLQRVICVTVGTICLNDTLLLNGECRQKIVISIYK